MTVFPPEYFARADESDDALFYDQPRLVQHIDEAAIQTVTELYRDTLPANGVILDLMSSWVSHLPQNVAYGRVVGLGMNEQELRANKRLDDYKVQNLNKRQQLPFDDNAFDGAICTVSVQYLQRPVEVFREVGRVLKPGAPFIVTFSNRCFPTKAVAIWLHLDDKGHVALVKRYFADAALFDEAQSVERRGGRWGGDPLYGVIGRRML